MFILMLAGKEKERDRQRETDRETERERQRDRETETERDRDRETGRLTAEKLTDRQIETDIKKFKLRETFKKFNRHDGMSFFWKVSKINVIICDNTIVDNLELVKDDIMEQ